MKPARTKEPVSNQRRLTISVKEVFAGEVISCAAALGWTPGEFCNNAIGVMLEMISSPEFRVVPGVCLQLDALKKIGRLPAMDSIQKQLEKEPSLSGANIIPFPANNWNGAA